MMKGVHKHDYCETYIADKPTYLFLFYYTISVRTCGVSSVNPNVLKRFV